MPPPGPRSHGFRVSVAAGSTQVLAHELSAAVESLTVHVVPKARTVPTRSVSTRGERFDPEELAVGADRHHLEGAPGRLRLEDVCVEPRGEARRQVDQPRDERGVDAGAAVFDPSRVLRYDADGLALDRRRSSRTTRATSP